MREQLESSGTYGQTDQTKVSDGLSHLGCYLVGELEGWWAEDCNKQYLRG